MRPIPPLSSPTSNLTNVGYYTAVVQNGLGAVASTPAFLALNYPDAGWLAFQNRRPDARVLTAGQRLSGPWSVELRAGPTPDQLFATSGPKLTTFTSGYFNGGSTMIPAIPAGGTGYIQVLIWDATFPTFEEAVTGQGICRVSNRFPVTPTPANGTNPPAALNGLQFPGYIEWPPSVWGLSNQVDAVGETVTLRANFLSYGASRWQWRKDGRDIASATGTFSGGIQSTLGAENLP